MDSFKLGFFFLLFVAAVLATFGSAAIKSTGIYLFKLGILLLLIAIATVATLVSPAMKRQPGMSSESQERITQEANQIDGELEDDFQHEDPSAEAVIKDTQLATGVLKILLKELLSIERNITIGDENKFGCEQIALNTHFCPGSSNGRMLSTVSPTGDHEIRLYIGRINSGRHTGVVGVVTHCIEYLDQTVAVCVKVWGWITSTGEANLQIFVETKAEAHY